MCIRDSVYAARGVAAVVEALRASVPLQKVVGIVSPCLAPQEGVVLVVPACKVNFVRLVSCLLYTSFCAVDFAEHKKYISNRKSYAQIRRVSDRLCRENGLSVVTPGAERGKQYAEWDAQRKGTSYKQKLKIAIDRLIPISKDLDDLLRRLEAEGYEIKRGKYISCLLYTSHNYIRKSV